MKMPLKSSNLLVGLNMALLGLFLVFWLYSEYQDEKKALEQEAGLQIAEQVILLGGMDLDSILHDLKVYRSDSTISIEATGRGRGYFIDMDTLGHLRPPHELDGQHKRLLGHIEKSSPEASWYKQQEIDSRDSLTASYQIVIRNDLDTEKGDSLWLSSELQANYLQATEGMPWQAFKNITPQILFALLLFALSVLATYSLRKSHQERQLALQSRNNMISNITHELKTPVSTIGVALEAIQDFDIKSDAVKTQAYIQTSRQELLRLSGLIDQILQFGQIDQGRENFVFQEEQIAPLMQEAVETMQVQAEARHSTITLDLPDLMWTLQADRVHLKNAFVNLIDNSLKYCPEEASIHVSAQKENGQFRFDITDDGPGIPKKYQDKVFERFFRIPSGDRHNVKGYGLGLSYVSEIVHAHGGTLELKSKEGFGTSIRINIPVTNG
ncbi:MAG: HAMP domain-containing histidine kinase [Saprospiraceae bacterium]|nr:HAMP domain-containing histidine kinase [Saprospiraceae bacterium]